MEDPHRTKAEKVGEKTLSDKLKLGGKIERQVRKKLS